MLGNLRGASPLSETMSESTLERNKAEKALINQTPQVLFKKPLKNCDKNGNNLLKSKGRKTFAFWTLICLLFILAIGNLVLTFTILAVLRLGQGMESIEFLPEYESIKLFGAVDLDHVYKKDGLLESFRDVPMTISSENGSVTFNLQTRASRSDAKLIVNASGVFVRGVNALTLSEGGAPVFSTAAPRLALRDPINNLHARQVSSQRISSPADAELTLRSEAAARLRGAEGTRMEARELTWSADQDIHLRSINGSVVLSGKEGVFVDVRYLPIAGIANATDRSATPQYKVCVCMPQGKLFRIAAPAGQRAACERVSLRPHHSPCL